MYYKVWMSEVSVAWSMWRNNQCTFNWMGWKSSYNSTVSLPSYLCRVLKWKLWDYVFFFSVSFTLILQRVGMRSSFSWSINILKFNIYSTHFWAYGISSVILTVWERVGGLDYPRIWTAEAKVCGTDNIQKFITHC